MAIKPYLGLTRFQQWTLFYLRSDEHTLFVKPEKNINYYCDDTRTGIDTSNFKLEMRKHADELGDLESVGLIKQSTVKNKSNFYKLSDIGERYYFQNVEHPLKKLVNEKSFSKITDYLSKKFGPEKTKDVLNIFSEILNNGDSFSNMAHFLVGNPKFSMKYLEILNDILGFVKAFFNNKDKIKN